MRQFGETFADEMAAAGLLGLPFSWGDDGVISGRENLTAEQNATLDAVLAAHDPTKQSVPAQVTALQARRALRASGLLPAVTAAVAAAADGNPDAADAFEYALTWQRDDSWIATLGPALNLTSADIDNLFIQASAL